MIAAKSKGQEGITLAEVLILCAIIGIMVSLSFSLTLSVLNRNRINSLILDWAGWFEQVRDESAQTVASDSALTSAGCSIDIKETISGVPKGSGYEASTVSPSACSPSGSFLIPSFFGKPLFDIASETATNIVYTPRGSVTNSSDITIKVLLNPSGPMRCLRITSVLGMIQIGKNDSATSISQTCSTFARV